MPRRKAAKPANVVNLADYRKRQRATPEPVKPEAVTVIEVTSEAYSHLAGVELTIDAEAYALMESLASAIGQLHGPVEGPGRAQRYREGVVASWVAGAGRKKGGRP